MRGNDLLRKIEKLDFALYETVLFLDGHPEDRRALAYYHNLRERLAALKATYEKEVGPLTIYGNEDEKLWQWSRQPWPWEKECD